MFNVFFFLLNAFSLPPVLRHWEWMELYNAKAAELSVYSCINHLKCSSAVLVLHTGLWGTSVVNLLTVTSTSYLEALNES